MEMKYLYEFIALSKIKNYWLTAEELYISQSSLSKHISALEKELGVSLFDRTTRQVELSPGGRAFLPYAIQITQLFDEYLTHSGRLQTAKTISIASTAQMIHYSIAESLAQYKQSHTECILEVIVEPHKNLKTLLQQGKVDFVWIGEPENEIEEDEFIRIPFLTEPLVAAVPRPHPLAELEEITAAQLGLPEVVISDSSSIEHYMFRQFCGNHHIAPNIIAIPGNNVLQFAVQTSNVAVLLESSAKVCHPFGISLVKIVSSPCAQISLLYAKRRRLSPGAKDFLNFMKERSI